MLDPARRATVGRAQNALEAALPLRLLGGRSSLRPILGQIPHCAPWIAGARTRLIASRLGGFFYAPADPRAHVGPMWPSCVQGVNGRGRSRGRDVPPPKPDGGFLCAGPMLPPAPGSQGGEAQAGERETSGFGDFS